MLTVDKLKKIVPNSVKNSVTQEVVDLLNKAGSDIGLSQEHIEEMFANNINILAKDNRKSPSMLKKYIRALKFAMLRQRMSIVDAFKIANKDRLHELSDNQITMQNNANAFARSKYVQQIEAQTLVDFSVFYGWARHEAMMKHIDLMRGKASPSMIPRYRKLKNGKKVHEKDANGNIIYDEVYLPVSPNVQREAAKTVLEITAPEKDNVLNVKIGLSDEAIQQQKQTEGAFRDLALQMREALEKGADITDVQVIGHSLAGSNKDEDDTE